MRRDRSFELAQEELGYDTPRKELKMVGDESNLKANLQVLQSKTKSAGNMLSNVLRQLPADSACKPVRKLLKTVQTELENCGDVVKECVQAAVQIAKTVKKDAKAQATPKMRSRGRFVSVRKVKAGAKNSGGTPDWTSCVNKARTFLEPTGEKFGSVRRGSKLWIKAWEYYEQLGYTRSEKQAVKKTSQSQASKRKRKSDDD